MEENSGAFVCNEKVFNRILRLEKRRGEKLLFMVITFENEINEKIFDVIFNELTFLLRTKDVISRNKNQIYMLLNNTHLLYGEEIVNRLNDLFNKKYSNVKPIFTLKNF